MSHHKVIILFCRYFHVPEEIFICITIYFTPQFVPEVVILFVPPYMLHHSCTRGNNFILFATRCKNPIRGNSFVCTTVYHTTNVSGVLILFVYFHGRVFIVTIESRTDMLCLFALLPG